MRTTVYFSGDYRKWTFYRYAGVPFYMRKIRVPGLSDAMNKGKIKYATLKINGQEWGGWSCDKNTLFFKKVLFRGNYHIDFEICYEDLEPPRWSHESN